MLNASLIFAHIDECEDEGASKEYVEETNKDAIMIAASKLVASDTVSKVNSFWIENHFGVFKGYYSKPFGSVPGKLFVVMWQYFIELFIKYVLNGSPSFYIKDVL